MNLTAVLVLVAILLFVFSVIVLSVLVDIRDHLRRIDRRGEMKP